MRQDSECVEEWLVAVAMVKHALCVRAELRGDGSMCVCMYVCVCVCVCDIGTYV